MEITRQIMKDLRPEIDNALTVIAEKYGIEITTGNGRFGGGGLDASFTLLLKTTGENGETAESRNFKLYADKYGMDIAWLGQSFNHPGGDSYTIAGINPKRRKYAILVIRDKDGQQRLMSGLGVQQVMKRKERLKEMLIEAVS